MFRTALVVTLALSAFTACKKKDGDSAPASDKGAAPAAGPVKTTPKDLFAEFTKPGADGMALLNKYHDGATFTATVKTAPGDEAPTSMILDVDGKNRIIADFTPESKDKIKTVKSGDSITATCKIGGASGAMMQVNDCVPQ